MPLFILLLSVGQIGGFQIGDTYATRDDCELALIRVESIDPTLTGECWQIPDLGAPSPIVLDPSHDRHY